MFGLAPTGKLTQFEEIFAHLYEHYGSRGWWPLFSEDSQAPKYIPGNYGKKSENEQLEIIVGSILTQNTSWKNAETALVNLNTQKLLRIEELSKISEEELADVIRPSRFSKQKAKTIKGIVKFLENESLEALEQLSIPELRKKLLALYGIGNETADSIILYAFNGLSFVIDAYTKRIFSRVGLIEESISYTNLQNEITKNIPQNGALYNEYHALIVALAQDHCTKKPTCSLCPIKNLCTTGSCVPHF